MRGDMKVNNIWQSCHFLRTVKQTLEAYEKTKVGNWRIVKDGVVKTAKAYLKSTTITYGPAATDFAKFTDALKEGGSSDNKDVNAIYYHVTDFLEKALYKLRDPDKDHRIVVFIDDLDRCLPERALEVLESIKSFFDIEGIVYVIGMNYDSISRLIGEKYELIPL